MCKRTGLENVKKVCGNLLTKAIAVSIIDIVATEFNSALSAGGVHADGSSTLGSGPFGYV